MPYFPDKIQRMDGFHKYLFVILQKTLVLEQV